MFQTKKIDLAEKPRSLNNSFSLNTRDALISTNLENYKKALHTLVGNMDRNPSNESIPKSKPGDRSPSGSNFPVYNINVMHNNVSSKYFVTTTTGETPKSATSHNHKRTVSQEKIRTKKPSMNKTVYDQFMKSDSFAKKINRSMSTHKINETMDEKVSATSKTGDFRDLNGQTLMNLSFVQEPQTGEMQAEDVQQLREMIHKYQLRDAIHRQEINKLTKANELLREHVKSMEKEMDKTKKNRELVILYIQSNEQESKYLARLETEINQLKAKDKSRSNSVEKKLINDQSKENLKYMKIIEELNKRIANITAEKKLVEDLLKNTLVQNENSGKKQNYISHKTLPNNSPVLTSIDLNAGKYISENNKVQKSSHKKTFETSHLQIQSPTDNSVLLHSFHTPKDEELPSVHVIASPEMKPAKNLQYISSVPFTHQSQQKINHTHAQSTSQPCVQYQNDTKPDPSEPSESDRNFSTRVHMPVPMVSLKDKLDMNQFRLDFTKLKKQVIQSPQLL